MRHPNLKLLLLIGMISSMVVPMVFATSELFEYYHPTEGTGIVIEGAIWRAQTFTTGTFDHTVTSIHVVLSRLGSPGTCTIAIRGTDVYGKPSSVILTTFNFDGNALETSPTWYNVTVPSCSLTSGTLYAIVICAPSGNASTDYIVWTIEGGTESYAYGAKTYSTDSGVTWLGLNLVDDFMFEIWGVRINALTSIEERTIIALFAILGLGAIGLGMSEGKTPIPALFMMLIGLLIFYVIGWFPAWYFVIGIVALAILLASMLGKMVSQR